MSESLSLSSLSLASFSILDTFRGLGIEASSEWSCTMLIVNNYYSFISKKENYHTESSFKDLASLRYQSFHVF